MPNLEWLNSFSNTQLELIVFVTEQCNFRCVYCYEDFKIGKIKNSTIQGIKFFLQNRVSKFSSLSISFFGGEPLLNTKAIYELSDWAKDLCLENKIQYYGSITTNGYLLKQETFIQLLKTGVKNYQITLDGNKTEHDNYRHLVNGNSTFDIIYQNIKNIANSGLDFECQIRFNVCDQNLDSVKLFISENALQFKNDLRFFFHFHPIFGIETIKLSNSKPVDRLKKFTADLGLQIKTENLQHVCYASKANSYVIRADGRIQKCTVAVESEINNVGSINSIGQLTIDNEKLKKWLLSSNKGCPLAEFAKNNLVVPYEKSGQFDKL